MCSLDSIPTHSTGWSSRSRSGIKLDPKPCSGPDDMSILESRSEEADPERPPSDLPILDPLMADDDLEREWRTVLITGASGNIGRKLRDAWRETYDLVL